MTTPDRSVEEHFYSPPVPYPGLYAVPLYSSDRRRIEIPYELDSKLFTDVWCYGRLQVPGKLACFGS